MCSSDLIFDTTMEEPDTLKIRFDEDEGKWYVYFTGPWGQCAYQSDPFDSLEAAEAFKLDQETQ